MSAPNFELTLESIKSLEEILLRPLDFKKVVQTVVDEVIKDLVGRDLGYRIVVLTLLDKKNGLLKRYSVTQTKEAKKALKVIGINFGESFRSLNIPISYDENASIKALKQKKPQAVHDFRDILVPAVSPDAAIKAQEQSNIKSSFIFPIIVRGEVIGTVIYSTSMQRGLGDKEENLLSYFTGIVGLAIQNSILYSKLATKSSELAKVNKELTEIDAQKDEFISIVSHELKTPVSIVKTNLWMITHVGGKNLSEQQLKLLSEMKSGLDRLGRMVNNILDVSRIEQGRLIVDIQQHELQQIVDTVLSEFRQTMEQNKLTLVVSKNFTSAYVDKEKFMEVLANLVSNSVKYTKKGGIRVNCVEENDYLRISVTDTGLGISKKDQGNLFKKFSRAQAGLKQDSPGASTGLGLFIVKKMVEEMGGNVGVKSTLNRGSTFWFTVPTKPVIKNETTGDRNKLKKWQEQTRL